MGLLSHRVERNKIAAGDHIYTWRSLFTYSHHGIYVGGNLVVHFRREQNIGSSEESARTSSVPTLSFPFSSCASVSNFPPTTCPNIAECGFRQPESEVILSCLDCFLSTGSLYLFEYGVSRYIAKFRGGTGTTVNSDPPQEVIHRAMHLLQNGFGNYDVFRNNCEDFALYCKTGLLIDDQTGLGRSGQAACVIGAPLAAVISSPLRLFMSSPVGVVTATAGMYCMSRYASDIGVRTDVVKVKVEDMVVLNGLHEPIEVAMDDELEPIEAAMDDEVCEGEITRDQSMWCHQIMGLLSHRVERNEIAAGDHIYTWRSLYTYSHHGIYVGGNKVVHFRPEQNIGSSEESARTSSVPTLSFPFSCCASVSNFPPTTCPNIAECGFRQPESGVILSCLDCFLSTGSLYLFEYGVSPSIYIAKLRGGCTTANSDPPQEVIHRAMHLLQNGFGNYDVFRNNCEDFALYCKTGLLIDGQTSLGRSGQAACMIGAPLAAVISYSLKLFLSSPVGVVTTTAGMYCMNRYASDIGVRTNLVKVKVEDMVVSNGLSDPIEAAMDDKVEPIEAAMDDEVCEGEITRDQVDVPASKRQRWYNLSAYLF